MLEEKGRSNAAKANKGRKRMLFEAGDLVWLHLRKERFQQLRKPKLAPRGTGPFKVLHKAGDNAYVLDLPADWGVSPTFNVRDLMPFPPDDEVQEDSGSNPSQDRGIDEGSSQPMDHTGPVTRPMSRGMAASSPVRLAGHQTPLVDVPASKELQLAGDHGPGSINYMVLSNLAF